MTHTIPPGAPKAIKAAAFGRELVKATKARNVPLKELERVTGVGHSSLDNYRRGLVLPKVETARVLAETLRWPRLGTMIVTARTFACARSGCSRTFRNDTGAPRKYCSDSCQRIAENLRMAQRRARSAGQTKDPRTRNAAMARLRGAVAIADERNAVLADAIDAMCRTCEPEGICRTVDCPLREFSPLPLARHRIGDARTESDIRSAAWSPERKARFGEQLARRWADPAEREKARAKHPFTLEVRARGAATNKARSFADRSRAAKKAQATRRLNGTQRGMGLGA